jgi:hypothetical protein
VLSRIIELSFVEVGFDSLPLSQQSSNLCGDRAILVKECS